MAKQKNKKLDLIIVFAIFILSALISIIFNLKPLTGGLLSLLIPSIYLMLREKKNFWKIFWGVFIFGVIIGFSFDFIVTLNQGWVVTRIVLPWKFFEILPIDNVIGWALMTLFILVFYEHFLDDEKNKKISKNLKWALIPFSTLLFLLLVLYIINPSLLKLPYIYLLGGSMAIIFPIALTLSKARFLEKFLKLGVFFFVVWFTLELVCLKNQGWIFPGQYIGQINILGLIFPFEELFFWMMFYSTTVVSYYEVFIDDRK